MDAATPPTHVPPPDAGARRELKTRQTRWAAALAARLARTGVSPNAISVASVAFASVSGICYAQTIRAQAPWADAVLLLAAAACMQLRLLCNMLDGMVAVEWGRASRAGEIFNDLPDRLADTIIFCGAGYAAAGQFGPTLGWAAAVVSLLTAYLRVLGRSVGAGTYFIGPMAKQHRMALLTGATLLSAAFVHRGWSHHILTAALAIIVFGALITCGRRLRCILGDLKHPAAGASEARLQVRSERLAEAHRP